MKKIIFLISTIIFAIALIIFQGYVIINYPDMTNTRMLITFWKEYLFIVCGFTISETLYKHFSNKELKELIDDLYK